MRSALHIDFETYCDLDLSKVGVGRYVSHPSFRVLLVAWALDDGPVQQWSPVEEASPLEASPPDDLAGLLADVGVDVWAHNAAFERLVLWHAPQFAGVRHALAIQRFRDTMVLARTCALPDALGKLSEVLGLSERGLGKHSGASLLRRFCSPAARSSGAREQGSLLPPSGWDAELALRPSSLAPEDWEAFKAYNRQDVEAEREVHRLLSRWAPPEHVWEMYWLDQEINDRGLPVNVRMVERAVGLADVEKSRLLRGLAELLGVENANSGPQVLSKLEALGYPFSNLTKTSVDTTLKLLDKEPERFSDPEKLRRALLLRQEAAASSVSKYAALHRATIPPNDGGKIGRLPHTLSFLGASRTGRWAGRVFQPQNLPRPHRSLEKRLDSLARAIEYYPAPMIRRAYGPIMECLRSAVRPAVQAPPGHLLVDADLAAIENRGIGWICGEEKILDAARNGRDLYIDFATYMFRQSYDELYAEYKAGDKSKRTLAKPAVLGAGYRLGKGEVKINPRTGLEEATGLLAYAWGMGVKLTPDEAAHAVSVFRETYDRVRGFWYQFEDHVKHVIRTGQPVTSYRFRVSRDSNFLRIRLPSGRYLHYYKPSIRQVETPWGEVRPTICYWGVQQGQWTRITTHGGKLLENVTQAVAADVLMHALRRATEAGINVILHVHDQIVALHPREEAEDRLQQLFDIMSTPPDWAPDIPLAADGSTSRVFIKD